MRILTKTLESFLRSIMGSSTSGQTVVGESASSISSVRLIIRNSPLYLLWAESAIPTPRSADSTGRFSAAWVSIFKNFDKAGGLRLTPGKTAVLAAVGLGGWNGKRLRPTGEKPVGVPVAPEVQRVYERS